MTPPGPGVGTKGVAPARRPAAPPAPPRPVASTTTGAEQPSVSEEVRALRAELRALREELASVVGKPDVPAASSERERLAGELRSEREKLEAIRTAVAGGLDPAAVADSVQSLESRVATLEAALAALPEAQPTTAPTLYEVSGKLQRLEASRAATEPSRPEPVAPVAPATTEPTRAAASEPTDKPALLPLELTAFGDFYYLFSRPDADDFHVGAVELDAALDLTPYVKVSTAIVYTGDEQAFGLGAFVIDCGLAGEGDAFLLQSKAVQKSGLSFGQFDVPFGIAYLEYPSVENRLVTSPSAVLATHGAWNDVGVQGYAVGEHWTAVAYAVNGQDYPVSSEETARARSAFGGRVSAKVDELFEVGGSLAGTLSARGNAMTFAGGDVMGFLGPFDLRAEYLLKHVDVTGLPGLTHGIYGRALARIDAAFAMARYDVVLEDSATLERRLSVGGGFEVFPQGEVRAVYEHGFDSGSRTVTLQLVGGSSFQPTGLRR